MRLHPDTTKLERKIAENNFRGLNLRYQEAKKRFDDGVYGDPTRLSEPIIISKGGEVYTLTHFFRTGDMTDLYRGTDVAGEDILAKVTRNPNNNDLATNEFTTLKTLNIHPEASIRADHAFIQDITASLRLSAGLNANRVVNIFPFIPDLVSLQDIINDNPDGIDVRDAAWMINRAFGSLTNAHSISKVHGAVLPRHILVNLTTHAGFITDWCYSVDSGNPLKAFVSAERALYPYEVFQKKPVYVDLDVYMLGKTLLRLLGPKVNQSNVGSLVPKNIAGVIHGMTMTAGLRYQTAYEAFVDWETNIKETYGKSFRPFTYKGKTYTLP